MGKNSFSDPLMGCSSNGEKGEEEEEGKVKWWRKVMDSKEARRQFFFALPMILTNVSYYFIPLLSVMFAGHLGELQLAAANLANSWATVTGFAFMVGSSGALETLCGQSYGAQQYRSLGIYLQSSCLISAFFSVLISLLWLYSEHILVFLHQDPQIAAAAALYIKHLIPGLFAYGFLNNILRFLQTQSVVMPLVFCSVLPTLLHGGVAYALVYWTSLSFQGAAVAVSVSLWVAVAMLGFYVICGKKFERTWVGFSTESFRHVFKNLTLALPSAAMVCLEYWAFELLVLLAGLMPNPEITTSLIAMCVNTEAISYMFAYGVSAAASTRVSNELGAGNPGRAKHAMAVALELSFLLSLAVVFALALGHNKWAGFFSDTPVIISEYASLTPLLVVSILFDFVQAILSGVARGCGWQHLAVGINLGTFYLIGMIIAALLGFKFKFYAKGLWMGLICGLSCQALGLLLLTHFAKWKKVQFSDSTGSEHNPILV